MPRSLVLGHRGLVGQALMRRLFPHGRCDGGNVHDLCESLPYFDRDWNVYLAAASVGGIGANVEQPADMIDTNIRIQSKVIRRCTALHAKLLFLGSSCIYPRLAPQPIPESALMTGPLEPTNSAYAMAKLCGLEMCEAYRKQYGLRYVALMPCSLYGPGRFAEDTHVINMMMKRFHEAKLAGTPVVSVWGTGRPLREFMHVDDLAEACVHFMNLPEAEGELINVGTGEEITIYSLAYMIAAAVGYTGDVEFDHTKPDGTPRKVMSSDKAHGLGWRARIGLREGLERTYKEFCEWSAT